MKVEITTVGLPLRGEQPEREQMAQEMEDRSTMDLPDGATIRELLQRIGDPAKEVQKVLVNGADADESTPLKEGDAVALVGQMSGM